MISANVLGGADSALRSCVQVMHRHRSVVLIAMAAFLKPLVSEGIAKQFCSDKPDAMNDVAVDTLYRHRWTARLRNNIPRHHRLLGYVTGHSAVPRDPQ